MVSEPLDPVHIIQTNRLYPTEARELPAVFLNTSTDHRRPADIQTSSFVYYSKELSYTPSKNDDVCSQVRIHVDKLQQVRLTSWGKEVG